MQTAVGFKTTEFSSLDFEQAHYENCDGWFCNVVGCKTHISIEPDCSPETFTWEVEKEQSWKSQLIKVTNKGKPPHMF